MANMPSFPFPAYQSQKRPEKYIILFFPQAIASSTDKNESCAASLRPTYFRAYYFLSPFGALTPEIRVDLPIQKRFPMMGFLAVVWLFAKPRPP